MKARRFYFVFAVLLLFVFALSPAAAGGSREAGEKETAEAAPAPEAEPADSEPEDAPALEGTEVQQEAETEYTESQEKLAGIGFQLPTGPFDAPEFTLRALNGEEVSLSGLQGKLVFLNFWATWCGPCRAEMPSMDKLYQELPEEEFEMIAVNVNEPEDTVRTFVEENGYSFPILLDKTGEVSGMYGVQGIPTTWIIGPDGDVFGRLVGTTEWDSPEKLEVFNFLLENN